MSRADYIAKFLENDASTVSPNIVSIAVLISKDYFVKDGLLTASCGSTDGINRIDDTRTCLTDETCYVHSVDTTDANVWLCYCDESYINDNNECVNATEYNKHKKHQNVTIGGKTYQKPMDSCSANGLFQLSSDPTECVEHCFDLINEKYPANIYTEDQGENVCLTSFSNCSSGRAE